MNPHSAVFWQAGWELREGHELWEWHELREGHELLELRPEDPPMAQLRRHYIPRISISQSRNNERKIPYSIFEGD